MGFVRDLVYTAAPRWITDLTPLVLDQVPLLTDPARNATCNEGPRVFFRRHSDQTMTVQTKLNVGDAPHLFEQCVCYIF